MAGFFVALMSGNNIFTVACGENCKVYFNHGPNINHTNSKIIELKKLHADSSLTSKFGR